MQKHQTNKQTEILPVGEFGKEEVSLVWTETATSVSGLLCHKWAQNLLGKHPGTQTNS